MLCPKCQHEWSEDSVPKAYIRKVLNDIMDNAESTEDRLRASDQLAKLEQYTGTNAKKEERKIGVTILHHSKIKRPGFGEKTA